MVRRQAWYLIVVSALLLVPARAGAQESNKEKPKSVQEQTDKLWEEVHKLFDSDKVVEVAETLERIVKLDPSDVQAWTMLGWHYAYNLSVDPDVKLNEEEQIKKGVDALKRGVAAVPRSADLRWELGFTYYDRIGDMETAIMNFEETLRLVDEGKAVLLDPEEKRPLRQWRRILMRTLAHAHERNMDFDCALEVYDRMIKEYDDEDVARFMANYIRNDYGKAWQHYLAGRYREALPEIDAALSRRVIAIGLYLKAECHLQLGEKDKAKETLITILKKNPRERVARNKLKALDAK